MMALHWSDEPGGYAIPSETLRREFERTYSDASTFGRMAVLEGGMEVTPIKSGRVWRQPCQPLYGDEGDTWIEVPERMLVDAVHRAFMAEDIDWLELEEDLEEVMWRGQEPKHTVLARYVLDAAGRSLILPDPTKPEGGWRRPKNPRGVDYGGLDNGGL